MPGSVRKQSVLVPFSSMPGQSKGRGRQTELCSCPAKQNEGLPGASEEDQGTGCTLNGPLCSPRKTFRITQHPIVGQVTTLHTHPLPTPTNNTFTFTNPVSLFIHSLTLLVGETWSQSSRRKKKTSSMLQMDGMAMVSPPALSPVSKQTLHIENSACLAAKTLNMPQ
ncbi:uncharacterized protein AKAME5_000859500 [Lates japonicus]|uniref:Uncharacterized protein n=1 Tax=Lates japonicus TaxID=270547 RepID=A0AAD3MMI9_LATJO|nr:uncharacterized protein AKAME5_000859500 [Lates japonicus]